MSFFERLSLIKKFYDISYVVDCPHHQDEIITFVQTILSIPAYKKGCVVEAGAYKGGSTAKFSIAAKLAKRKLIIFDSFKGTPKHNEMHDQNIFDDEVSFPEGSFCGTLKEVRENISRFGDLECCKFIKGWFEDTMPDFSEPIAAIYLDVDLASSTRTCLKYLYPLLIPGGVLWSQDGHFPHVINTKFWEEEVGCPKPYIQGLGKQILIKIIKPNNQ